MQLADIYPSLCRQMVQIANTIPIWDNKTGTLDQIQFGLGVDRRGLSHHRTRDAQK
jgi:hypothetical protein